jgi:imidazoleglycerol-phosphate dehydratase
MSTIQRDTKETTIRVTAEIGTGTATLNVDDPFLSHMLETFARYSGIDLDVEARGDLRHHLVEDVAIALGLAVKAEVPPTAVRYGSSSLPMDDAWVDAAVDVGGRPYYVGRLPADLYEHFLRSFAYNLAATLHVKVRRGRDRHHVVEAAMKAVGLALREALGDSGTVFSTKGPVHLEIADDE